MTPFDEAGFPLTLAGDIGADEEGPTGLDRIAAARLRAELEDIAWNNRHGWPAGGA